MNATQNLYDVMDSIRRSNPLLLRKIENEPIYRQILSLMNGTSLSNGSLLENLRIFANLLLMTIEKKINESNERENYLWNQLSNVWDKYFQISGKVSQIWEVGHTICSSIEAQRTVKVLKIHILEFEALLDELDGLQLTQENQRSRRKVITNGIIAESNLAQELCTVISIREAGNSFATLGLSVHSVKALKAKEVVIKLWSDIKAHATEKSNLKCLNWLKERCKTCQHELNNLIAFLDLQEMEKDKLRTLNRGINSDLEAVVNMEERLSAMIAEIFFDDDWEKLTEEEMKDSREKLNAYVTSIDEISIRDQMRAVQNVLEPIQSCVKVLSQLQQDLVPEYKRVNLKGLEKVPDTLETALHSARAADKVNRKRLHFLKMASKYGWNVAVEMADAMVEHKKFKS